MSRMSDWRRTGRSAGFQTCCIADLPSRQAVEAAKLMRVWKPATQQTWKSALRVRCRLDKLILKAKWNKPVRSSGILPRLPFAIQRALIAVSLHISQRGTAATEDCTDGFNHG